MTSKQEGAELFVRPADDGRPSDRTATVRLRAEMLVDPPRLEPFLRRELRYVADMVDPAFAYEPTLGQTESVAQENLLRDRYRVLWAAYVDGRLAQQGRLTDISQTVHADRFAKVLPDLAPAESRELLARVWQADGLTHGDLLAIAREPAVAQPVRDVE